MGIPRSSMDPFRDPYEYLGSFMDLWGPLWAFGVICGLLGTPVGIWGHPWELGVIYGHLGSSVGILGSSTDPWGPVQTPPSIGGHLWVFGTLGAPGDIWGDPGTPPPSCWGPLQSHKDIWGPLGTRGDTVGPPCRPSGGL